MGKASVGRLIACCHHENPQPYRGHRCHECFNTWRNQHRRKQQNYDEWFDKQHGSCAFCGLPLEPNSNCTHLDHDHRTGRKRGLVHAKCNLMIGGIEKALDLIGLDRILAYVCR